MPYSEYYGRGIRVFHPSHYKDSLMPEPGAELRSPPCECGHDKEDHSTGASTMCAHCKCASYTSVLATSAISQPQADAIERFDVLRRATATEAKAALDDLLAKPLPKFPFAHRDRYEVAYTLLVWQLLTILDSASDDPVPSDEIIRAMKKAAGELS